MLTASEQKAVEQCQRVTCTDEWCDGKCALCSEPHVLLGDALAAIDAVREERREERRLKIAALLDDT